MSQQMEGSAIHYKALFHFKASHNDELNFEKGDMITVTQAFDGGWWEGTLREKTGWFPSNYVKVVEHNDKVGSRKEGSHTSQTADSYHSFVLQNFLDTEREHVSNLNELLHKYLEPLETAAILPPSDFKALIGNLHELVRFQEKLLENVEETAKLPLHEQKVAGLLLKRAASMGTLYRIYCSNHPNAACVLTRYRDELEHFMEQGVESEGRRGIRTLTMSMSEPLRRLEKYPTLLRQLESHLEDSHVDRGDTQRAISVYQEIHEDCMRVRKEKEDILELSLCYIEGFPFGENMSCLGEILLVSPVVLVEDSGERHERHLVLFPDCLVLLSVGKGLTAYFFQDRIALSGLSVIRVEDTEFLSNSFELCGGSLDGHVTVSCRNSSELRTWLEMLKQRISLTDGLDVPADSTASPTSSIHVQVQPLAKQELSSVTPPPPSSPPPPPPSQELPVTPSSLPSPIVVQCENLPPVPPRHRFSPWRGSCLRPTPPLRPSLPTTNNNIHAAQHSSTTSHATKQGKPTLKRSAPLENFENDALMLRVIEAYCARKNARNTVNSALLDSPQVLIAEEEKIICEEVNGDKTVMEEKSLVDTVYALKDEVTGMQEQVKSLTGTLSEERRARKRLENMLRKSLKSLCEIPPTSPDRPVS